VRPELVRSTPDECSADASPLEGFWASDTWVMSTCPLVVGHGIFRFDGPAQQLRDELKLAVRAKLIANEWSLRVQRTSLVNRIVAWLASRHATTRSLLNRPLESWMLDLRGYLLEQGLLRQPMRRQINRVQEELRSPLRDPAIVILRSLYAKLLALRQPSLEVPEFAKDVWDVRRMGVVGNPLNSDYSLSFVKLAQPWLRTAAKHFVRHTIVTTSYRNAKGRLGALKRFSAYLAQVQPSIEPQAVDRSLMVAYLAHIRTLGMAPATIGVWLVALRSFFELCAREGWAAVPQRPLVYREDFPRQEHPLPRFIAEDVLQQLNAHLDDLRPVYRNMTLMLEECGMRIGEACSLPLGCLSRDAEGDYFLRYHQPKMRKELQIPISRELAMTIQEQQRAVRERWGDGVTWLFPNRKGGPVTPRGYRIAINELAYRHRVRDATGALFRVHPHGFRHTVGTRMINNDVPQRVVQQFLGHESPSMTARYAHIHDATMKRKLAEYRGKVIDITGKVVEGDGPPISNDALWLKRNILAQALANGVCRLPIQQGECPHANACLTCVHFGTSSKHLAVLKEQLVQTERILEAADAQGWTRQAEMNQRVRQNLLTVIRALEADDQVVIVGGQLPTNSASSFVPLDQL
jgi:integrase